MEIDIFETRTIKRNLHSVFFPPLQFYHLIIRQINLNMHDIPFTFRVEYVDEDQEI